MNILLGQLDHVDWDCEVVIEIDQLGLCEYLVEGYVIYQATAGISVSLFWTAELQIKQVVRDDSKLIIVCDYTLEHTGTDSEGFDLAIVEEEEADEWLVEFAQSARWQELVLESLPNPEMSVG